jgi:hypothetical protein
LDDPEAAEGAKKHKKADAVVIVPVERKNQRVFFGVDRVRSRRGRRDFLWRRRRLIMFCRFVKRLFRGNDWFTGFRGVLLGLLNRSSEFPSLIGLFDHF